MHEISSKIHADSKAIGLLDIPICQSIGLLFSSFLYSQYKYSLLFKQYAQYNLLN